MLKSRIIKKNRKNWYKIFQILISKSLNLRSGTTLSKITTFKIMFKHRSIQEDQQGLSLSQKLLTPSQHSLIRWTCVMTSHWSELIEMEEMILWMLKWKKAPPSKKLIQLQDTIGYNYPKNDEGQTIHFEGDIVEDKRYFDFEDEGDYWAC